MSLKLSRRDFVKASAVASASAMLLGAAPAYADDAPGTTAGADADDVKVIPSACSSAPSRTGA